MTGTSRGIGSFTAKKCEGISKEMICISSSPYANWERKIECHSLELDLADYHATYNLTKEKILDTHTIIFSHPKKIGIILCAGSLGEYGGLLSSNLDDWTKTFNCNVLGNLAVVKAVIETFGKSAHYRILFFGGGGAAYGYPDFSGYALSKVSIVRAAENLSLELKKNDYKASVVVLAPGAVETEMLKKVMEHGGSVKTKTNIDEPASFVFRFLVDSETNIEKLDGRFIHVRDEFSEREFDEATFKLRRIE